MGCKVLVWVVCHAHHGLTKCAPPNSAFSKAFRLCLVVRSCTHKRVATLLYTSAALLHVSLCQASTTAVTKHFTNDRIDFTFLLPWHNYKDMTTWSEGGKQMRSIERFELENQNPLCILHNIDTPVTIALGILSEATIAQCQLAQHHLELQQLK